ncbi:FAD-binding oxidoreductase [Elioraea tepida]|uniref:FAD-binding oxidoreductase n=1 Tax=Elioraea tepida TaxID=2843330 RepID=A0A975U0Y9_9PROT|nr:FAD-binding oxidoreductase [Elioraea tepida]QXM23773.1 FAD-binding oxidoreductase [Elioraea tepida]
MTERFDVVIVGGAAVGASVAWYLARDPLFRGSVLVLEKDPSYARAATALSASSIRRQFSCPINVRLSGYGIALLREAPAVLGVDAGLHEGGYLFLATEAGREALRRNHAVQIAEGADIAWLEPAALAETFPWLNIDGLSAGTWGRTGEGWFDGFGVMQAMRRASRAAGVAWRTAEVTRILVSDARARGVALADGSEIDAGTVVVTAGTGAAPLLETAGLALPVRPRKRTVFHVLCPDALPRFPLLIDPIGVWVRPEGKGFICGVSPPEERDPDAAPDDFEPNMGEFEETVWPTLAARVPAFERLRLERAWAGHYDMNLFDQNAFAGAAPDVPNLLFACGFSGHGLQQAPAIGRGLAELAAHGRYLTLDLSPLSPARLAENRPLIERNVV